MAAPALDALLTRAVAGRGGTVVLEGRAGVGRSRLLHEAALLAAQRGVHVMHPALQSATAPLSLVETSAGALTTDGPAALLLDDVESCDEAAGSRLVELAKSAPQLEVIEHAEPLLQLLEEMAGVRHWHALHHETDPNKRMRRFLRQAFADYEASPPELRELTPIEATRDLVGAVVAGVSICSHTLDLDRIRALSQRLLPVLALAESIRALHALVLAVEARTAGRVEVERKLRLRVAEALHLTPYFFERSSG